MHPSPPIGALGFKLLCVSGRGSGFRAVTWSRCRFEPELLATLCLSTMRSFYHNLTPQSCTAIRGFTRNAVQSGYHARTVSE